MRPAAFYLHTYNWAQKGRLEYLYAPGTMPARVMDALDLIDSEKAKMMQES